VELDALRAILSGPLRNHSRPAYQARAVAEAGSPVRHDLPTPPTALTFPKRTCHILHGICHSSGRTSLFSRLRVRVLGEEIPRADRKQERTEL
jgi:hypothetical protein